MVNDVSLEVMERVLVEDLPDQLRVVYGEGILMADLKSSFGRMVISGHSTKSPGWDLEHDYDGSDETGYVAAGESNGAKYKPRSSQERAQSQEKRPPRRLQRRKYRRRRMGNQQR